MEYNVTLLNEVTGNSKNICVPEDQYIFDIAEAEGIDLPVSCRAGKCISCVGKLVEGKIEDESMFLQKAEEEAGFVLLCCSYARSNCTILVNQEDALLDLSSNN